MDLVAAGSIEMGAHRPQDARAIAALLPAGTPVYVNHLPRHSLADSLASLVAVRAAGPEPVPHIAARRNATHDELGEFLAQPVAQAGVRKAHNGKKNNKGNTQGKENSKNKDKEKGKV